EGGAHGRAELNMLKEELKVKPGKLDVKLMVELRCWAELSMQKEELLLELS
ncbi:hypothetical protein A2U01_0063712, partial [Trifolium medium]|nr:hypothetical protein [Trifolium medium]